MTYLDLIREVDWSLEEGNITGEKFKQMIEPLHREITAQVEELQEIRQEIDNIHIYGENDPATYQRFVTGNQVKQMILEIIDSHISAWSGKEDG